MAIMRVDFYRIFQEEGAPFYNNSFGINKEEFNDWVINSFNRLIEIESLQKIIPKREIIDKFISLGYVHKAHQCHYSSKAITLLDPDFEYWTGFVNRQDFINPIITHSFNIYKGDIVDFARINQDFSIQTAQELYLPHIYYGINIPSEFINNYRDSVLNDFSMNPLLFEWYNHIRT